MITLYLDSSDYSNMADQSNRQAQDIAEQLQAWIRSGKIEIPFSSVHIVECAHVDKPSKSMALKRMRMIDSLSNGKCFKWWIELMLLEEIAAAKSETLPIDYAKSDNGQWFPTLRRDERELRNWLVSSIKEGLISAGLNRQNRRLLMKHLIQNRRLTDSAVKMLKPNRQELLKSFADRYPLSERFYKEDLLVRWLTGQVPFEEVTVEIEKAFADLQVFIGWIYETYDPEKKLTRWLRASGGKLAEDLEALRVKVDQFTSSAASLGMTQKTINLRLRQSVNLETRRSTALWQQFDSNLERLKKEQVDRSMWQSKVVNSPCGSIPSLDALLNAMAQYVMESALPSSTRRRLKRSDAGDLYHMTYIPYVDAFRCDEFASTIARSVAQSFGTKIIEKFVDLPKLMGEAT